MFGNWRQSRLGGRLGPRRRNGRGGLSSLLISRSALGKLAIGLVAALATVAVIDYGGPPFPNRAGQTVTRDIRAKVRFTRPNETLTARLREKAAEAVAPIYTNDPRPIEQLHEAAQGLADAIAGASMFDQLPASAASDWGLTAEAFAVLRPALETPNQHQDFGQSLRSVFQRLAAQGLLDPEPTEPRTEPRTYSQIEVRSADGSAATHDLSEVTRAAIVDANGRLVQTLAQFLPSKELADQFFRLLQPRLAKLPATLRLDADATEEARRVARDAVEEQHDVFDKGDLLVEQGDEITPEQIALLVLEHNAWVAEMSRSARVQRTASLGALVIGLWALAAYYILRFERRVAASPTRVAMLGALVVATVAAADRLHGDILHGEIIPVALGAMMLAIAYSQQFALLVTFALGLLCAWMFGTGVNDLVVLTGGTAAATLALNRVRSRTKLISVGATAGATYFALTWATGLFASQPWDTVLYDSLRRLLWGVIAGLLMSGILPFLERFFGIVTDINLLELSDVSHPLLLELMRKAPGTYNHSVAVATLAEAAAEQIEANSLLVRVGSYFHDIGKMLKPDYFVENQTPDSRNRHEDLNPAMSTLIIIGHVKDGAHLAREHHLPQPIVDLIEQHHGTTLVEYFYREAEREVQQDDEDEYLQESAFRYPGPKPQTREACIVMLADAVESASRTLSEPTPGRIEGLVHDLALKRLLDGQFDDCGITLQEIGTIKESLIKSLNAIYHGRVKYPEPKSA